MTTPIGFDTVGEAPVFRFPASFAQQRLWFLDHVNPGSPAYNIARSLRCAGPLDVGALEQSLGEIVRRHESLRTRFSAVEGQPMQEVMAALSVPLTVVDLQHLPEAEREEAAHARAAAEAREPFDLSHGPLVRTTLLRLAPLEHVLLVTLHHIVADEWSMGVLLGELATLYTARVTGTTAPLPELAVQYADYAQWQRDWLRGEALADQIAYWREQLAGAPPVLDLPTDRPRPPLQSFRGATQRFLLPPALTQALRRLSRREGATLFMTLLAAFQALLHRYTGQDDLVVGSPIAGRTRTELEGLIGFFVNTLALRTDLSGDPSFRELLGRVRETALGAYAHQDLPFERLVEELQPRRDPSYNPLFQVMFGLQNVPAQAPGFAGLTVQPLLRTTGTAKFDLTVLVAEAGEGLSGEWEYSTDLFDAGTVERMIGHFRTLLEGVAADPDRPLSALPLLPEPERHRLLHDWNATQADYPADRCLHQLFEAQADRTPDAVALVCGAEPLTYGELDRRANRLARRLRALGVGPGASVGLCVERSPALVAAVLGILKAGGAYVPLDPAYPTERLAFMLADARVAALVTEEALLARLPDVAAPVVRLDADAPTLAQESSERVEGGAGPEHPAYIMYTSGSTGRPKGVATRHRNVVRLLFGVEYVRLDSTQVFLHLAPITFDASTFEIWGALLHGARCVLFPPRLPTPRDIGAAIRRHNVTTLWLTASLFNLVIDEAPDALQGIAQLLIGGEALSVAHVRRALALLPETEIVNGYGPTECTTFACCYRIPSELSETARSIPIGRPIANTQAYILDDHGQPVPIGVTGELHIGGDGLARGYLRRPDLTAAAFIPHPFGDEPGARLYKTGDLARYLPDGTIEFLGRRDHQVKLRGMRIELGEIEAVLTQHPAVREAAVLLRDDAREQKQLVAYLVAQDNPRPSSDEIRRYLATRLPNYMVPAACVWLDRLPLSASGKVDRRSLRASDHAAVSTDDAFAAPETPLQQRIAEIWGEVLGVWPIGIRSNFFDLGGHSLLAARLIDRLERAFGMRLPFSTLLAGPTIEQVAQVLQQPDETPPWQPLMTIRSGGARRPFFFWHGDLYQGGPFCWKIARYLDADQPFYALHPHGLDDQPVPSTIEEMAADHLERLLAIQPQGPYLLGGHCNGAFVAYEIAQRLRARGEDVDLLVLIDAERADSHPRFLRRVVTLLGSLVGLDAQAREDVSVRLRYIASRAAYFAALPRDALGRRALTRASDSISLAWATIVGADRARAPVRPEVRRQRAREVWRAHWTALLRYAPRPYPGRVTLFWSSDFSPQPDGPTAGWREVAAEVEVHAIAGTHLTCKSTYVQDLAEQLCACLRRAQAAS